ncbi:MAG: hypothetical protein JW785_07320 [Acidimicrobiia bacterium]|nr:hypothetical protein [Acidimicrobiia bacterium]
MTAPFDVIVVASPVHPAGQVAAVVAPYLAALAARGGRVVEARGEGPCPTVVLVATGGSERRLVDLWGESVPLLLLAHPGHNSLPAALEALAAARARGGRGRIVYLAGPDDAAGWAGLDRALADAAAAAALRRARVGLVGAPSDWLVASHPDAGVVRRVWGPMVVEVAMERFLAACRAAALEGAAGGGIEAALRSLIREEHLDAVTVRCFDLIDALDATACLALAALNDEGVVAGCEGDVPSAVAMLWVRALLGTASWMANPARVDIAAGTVTLAHCTVPRSLVGAVRADTHFESGRGSALAGEMPAGPVTLLRIGRAGLDRLWLEEGEVVGSGSEPDLCRTQATVRLEPGVPEGLLAAPLGNHLVLIPGCHAARLRGWWETFIG